MSYPELHMSFVLMTGIASSYLLVSNSVKCFFFCSYTTSMLQNISSVHYIRFLFEPSTYLSFSLLDTFPSGGSAFHFSSWIAGLQCPCYALFTDQSAKIAKVVRWRSVAARFTHVHLLSEPSEAKDRANSYVHRWPWLGCSVWLRSPLWCSEAIANTVSSASCQI